LEKNYYPKLEEQISKYMIKAGNDWKISKDEISFYYVLGMDLSYSVMIKKEEGKKSRRHKDMGKQNKEKKKD